MNLRKPLALFLAFFVLISQQGFAFRVHYCGNSIASVQLARFATGFSQEKSCCGDFEAISSCCSSKTITVVKKATDYTLVQTAGTSYDSFPVIAQFVAPIKIDFAVQNATIFPQYYWESHAPPLFKLYSQYVFYESI